MRLDKLTVKAQEAVQAAQSLADQHGHQAIEPEHLLVALLQQREGVVGPVLAKLGAPDLQSGRGRLMRWTYLPAAADLQTVTVVRFEDGKVVTVDRRILR